MNYTIIYQDVQPKWRNYAGYVKEVFKSIIEVTNDSRLNKSVAIILINDEEMHHMNFMYRQLDRSTDVLTFVDDEDPEHLGDIFINTQAVINQAQEYGHSLRREFSFLVTHGLLHLLGFDHHTNQEEKEMFDLQERILDNIGATR